MGKKNFSYKRKKKRRGGSAFKEMMGKEGMDSFQKVLGKDGSSVIENKMSGLQSSLESMNKSRMAHLVDYLLYTLYSLAGIFIYYPSFLINLPDTTLEKLVPTKEGCKTLFGDELICKRKLKCFFKKCSLMEDPIGYKLQRDIDQENNRGKKKNAESRKIQKIQMGGKEKKRTIRRHKYMNHLPYKVRKGIERSHKKDMKQFYALIKSILKDGRSKLRKSATSLNRKKYKKGGIGALAKDMALQKLNEGGLGTLSKDMAIQKLNEDGLGELAKGMALQKLNEMGGPSSAIQHLLGDPSDRINQSNCVNQVKLPNGTTVSNHIFCDTSKPIKYKPGDHTFFTLMNGRTQQQRVAATLEAMNKHFEMLTGTSKTFKGGSANMLKNMAGKQGADMLQNMAGKEGADMLQNMAGKVLPKHSKDTPPDITENDLVEQILKESMDSEALFKLLIAYKMLDEAFGSSTSDEQVQSHEQNIPDQMYGVEVAFPWHTKSSFTTPEERRKCLFAHLTKSNLGDDYKTKDLYEKCFVCKNCTLANTSFKAWDKFVSSMFTNPKSQFSSISRDLFDLMKKNYEFSLYSIKQYYLFSILALYFVHPLMNPQKLTVEINTNDGKRIPLRDLILGIPQIKSSVSPTPEVEEQLRQTYLTLKILNLEEVLYKLCYQTMFKNILKEHDMHIEKRLHEIKKRINETSQIFYGRQRIYTLIDNDIDLQELDNYHPFKIIPRLQEMDANKDVYNEEEINRAFNEEFKLYVPLFKMLLDPTQYDQPHQYETNSDEMVRNFQGIVEKINHNDDSDDESEDVV